MKQRLTDRLIDGLEYTAKGQHSVFDDDVTGFYIVVGRKTKTFTVKIAVKGKTLTRALGRYPELKTRAARKAAKGMIAELQSGKVSGTGTLREAWERYLTHLRLRGRSERTIEDYTDQVTRLLKPWLDTRLDRLSEKATTSMREYHDKLTRNNGPYAANHAFRALRAIYLFSRKHHDRNLPFEHPASAIDFHPEYRRNTAMSAEELPGWWAKLRTLPNPIRQEFHLFTLLTGSRTGALRVARWEHLDMSRRVLHVPNPKGGTKRAFDIPLSRAMVSCLRRTRDAARVLYADSPWVFPANSASGHLEEYRESRTVLPKWGGDLRQTWRTMAVVVGLDKLTAELLLNHAPTSVGEGYITRAALNGHLRKAQERMSRFLMTKLAA